jgi:hypothetical protein
MKDFFSIYEQGSTNKNYYRRLALLKKTNKKIIINKKVGENYLQVSSDIFTSAGSPEYEVGVRYDEADEKKQIKNRYVEMQAALNMISANTLLGVGLGNYQNNIGVSFNDLPKINTAEPNQNNTYLIIASTMGIFGLAVLIWILSQSFNLALRKYTEKEGVENSCLFLGIAGAMVAIFVEGFFSMIFFSSLLVPLVLLFFLSSSDFYKKQNTEIASEI